MDSQGDPRHLLFAYGTLKRGQPNHARLARATLVGECRTAPHYRLLTLGSYPALSPGGDRAIVGELYRIPVSLWEGLDRFEGPEYTRARVLLASGGAAQAYFLAARAVASALPLFVDCWPPA